ncbi:MAG: hypothetical protein AAF704_07420, partial [Cyanobacteria bacterium P01_D01_bin.123]
FVAFHYLVLRKLAVVREFPGHFLRVVDLMGQHLSSFHTRVVPCEGYRATASGGDRLQRERSRQ